MNNHASSAPDAPTDGARDVGRPAKWWQWILVYPTFALSVCGSIPTLVIGLKACSAGVPFASYYDAERQRELWERNYECLGKNEHKGESDITTQENVKITAVVCGSGDVLLTGQRPSWRYPQERWVAWGDIAPPGQGGSVAGLTGLFPIAYAGAAAPIRVAQAPRVICQRMVGNGLLLQRLATPYGCLDQVINTYTGWVVSRQPAPCAAC